MVESPRFHEILEAKRRVEIVPFVVAWPHSDCHAQRFLTDALELVENVAWLAREAEVIVVAGGALSRAKHWQIDSVLKEVPFGLFLASVFGAAAGASLHTLHA